MRLTTLFVECDGPLASCNARTVPSQLHSDLRYAQGVRGSHLYPFRTDTSAILGRYCSNTQIILAWYLCDTQVRYREIATLSTSGGSLVIRRSCCTRWLPKLSTCKTQESNMAAPPSATIKYSRFQAAISISCIFIPEPITLCYLSVQIVTSLILNRCALRR